MKLLDYSILIKFENPLWKLFPELAVYDTILEKRIDILKLFELDITKDLKNNNLGRKDSPTVEQIVRAIIYKEVRGITYEELEKQQFDSIICKEFLKLNKKAFSDSMYQNYVKKIKPETIKCMILEINKIAIEMGYEDTKDIRIDSTTVETNVHYPTNNSLVYDCIKTATNLLQKIIEKHSNQYNTLISRLVEVKKVYYNLNNIKQKPNESQEQEKQTKELKQEQKLKQIALMKSLFEDNLNFLQQISLEVKEAIKNNLKDFSKKDADRIKDLDKQIETVYTNAYRFQIEGKKVENEDKIFSIYEEHTDIIVKGYRKWLFGHKINLASGKSNLILDCDVLEGNPADVDLYENPLRNIESNYNSKINSAATDGGYACKKNLDLATDDLKIKNIVFTKIVGSVKNVVENPEIEKKLKNFRAGAEAVISNLKRGFDLVRVDWKGFEMFKAKVFWGVVGYNIRVLTGHIMNTLFPKPEKA